jgi:membrane-associated phospholipid phosphatase
MSRLSRVTLTALIGGAIILFCIAFIDRPVEVYVAAHKHYRLLYQAMASPSLLSLPFAIVYLSAFAIAAPFAWPPGPRARALLALSLAILGATAAKDELKWLFGRPWPNSWVNYGTYAFHPFTDSFLYGGFPSGHTAYISAPMCLLCWLAPQYRALWIAVMAMVMIGLVGAGYHFVGDVIAGFLTGLAAAAAVVSFQSSVVSKGGS